MTTTTDPRAGWTSASNAAADRLCPGRHNAQKNLPDTKGEWADYGQLIHSALADDKNIPRLNPEQRDMFDSIREVEKKVITQVFGGEPDNSNRVWRHQRYWAKIPDKWPEPTKAVAEHSGEADMVMRRKDTALILDYKVLSGDVPDSPKNEQLRDLAVMVWRTLKVDSVVVAIIQPLVTWSPELCRYDKASLERAEQEMWDRVRKSNDPNAQRFPSESACKYCKAKNQCPERARWLSVMVPTMTDLSTPVAEWTPEQRAMFCERRSIAQQWLDDCEGQMKSLLTENPDAVPGWILKDGDKRESVSNPQELFDRFRVIAQPKAADVAKLDNATNEEQVTEEQIILEWFMNCVKITKSNLEAQVRAVTGTKGQALKGRMKNLLEGIVEVKQNQPSLARKEDK